MEFISPVSRYHSLSSCVVHANFQHANAGMFVFVCSYLFPSSSLWLLAGGLGMVLRAVLLFLRGTSGLERYILAKCPLLS